MHDQYLGDGVYASFDGFQIVLDLRAQDSTTRIALDTPTLHALFEYSRYLKQLAETKCYHCGRPLICEEKSVTILIDDAPEAVHVNCEDAIRNGVQSEETTNEDDT